MAYGDFLTGGEAALLILLIVALEGIALSLRQFKRNDSVPLLQWLSPLLAGGALVLALFLSQRNAPPELLGICLLCAGLAHASGYR
ncbi:MAG: hypothetical protein AAF991_03120, partial [Pseudomonadota bacterium]